MLSTVFVVKGSGDHMALAVHNLVIRYGSLTAVDSVTFSARYGEVTALLGRNGAGKTSTIEACEGLRRIAAGSIEILGTNIERVDAAVKSRIGVMLQDGGIAPAARVRHLVNHYCRLYDRGADADAILARLGLAHRANSTWRRLSGGERQRFSLALALAARPEIIFLDEPTAGVDLDGRDAIRNVITELIQQDCCVVLATHDLDEAERIAHRAVVMHAGRVVLDDEIMNLCRSGRRLEDVVREATR